MIGLSWLWHPCAKAQYPVINDKRPVTSQTCHWSLVTGN
jgi:hypothetical protein